MEIIANPTSGKNNGNLILQQVQAYLNSRNIPYNVHLTKEVGHGKLLAQQLSHAGAKTIIALGGDGTCHEVLNGIDFNRSRMGIIPSGRGNDYAIGTGISLDPCKTLSAIVEGKFADYDYIQVGNLRCLNVAGTGLDVSVLQHTSDSANKISYTTSLAHCLLNYKPYAVTVEVEGQVQQYSCVMVGVCNGTQFGGGIKLCPVAKHNDGLLDLVVIEKPARIPTLLVMPGFVKGKHMKKSYVKHCLCKKVKITSNAPIELDGEIYNNVPFDAEIVASGLKTFDYS